MRKRVMVEFGLISRSQGTQTEVKVVLRIHVDTALP